MTKKEKQMAGINKNNAKVKAEKEKAVKDALEKFRKSCGFAERWGRRCFRITED